MCLQFLGEGRHAPTSGVRQETAVFVSTIGFIILLFYTNLWPIEVQWILSVEHLNLFWTSRCVCTSSKIVIYVIGKTNCDVLCREMWLHVTPNAIKHKFRIRFQQLLNLFVCIFVGDWDPIFIQNETSNFNFVLMFTSGLRLTIRLIETFRYFFWYNLIHLFVWMTTFLCWPYYTL